MLMLVEVYKAGRNDQACGVNRAGACQRPRCDSDDFITSNSDIAHGIESCFRIDDASALQDKVKRFRRSPAGCKP
jgi:hypothetical protein